MQCERYRVDRTQSYRVYNYILTGIRHSIPRGPRRTGAQGAHYLVRLVRTRNVLTRHVSRHVLLVKLHENFSYTVKRTLCGAPHASLPHSSSFFLTPAVNKPLSRSKGLKSLPVSSYRRSRAWLGFGFGCLGRGLGLVSLGLGLVSLGLGLGSGSVGFRSGSGPP